jgi:hypothetical protein
LTNGLEQRSRLLLALCGNSLLRGGGGLLGDLGLLQGLAAGLDLSTASLGARGSSLGAGTVSNSAVVEVDSREGREGLEGRALAEGVHIAAGSAEVLALAAAHLLDLGGVDHTGDVSVLDHGHGQDEASLEGAALSRGAVHLLEALESTLRPDDEATEVATRGELEEVKEVDIGNVDTTDVAEGILSGAGVEDQKGTLAGDVAAVTPLTLRGADVAAGINLLDISEGLDGREELDGLGGLVESGDGIINDERDLRDGVDAVAAGRHQGGHSGGGEGRGNGKTALVLVDVAVPAAERLRGGVHVSSTAHVTVGTLARAVRTATGHAGNTGNSAAGTPRLGGGAVALTASDTVGLASVLRDVGMHEADEVVTDGRHEDGGERGRADDLRLRAGEDVDVRAGGHFFLSGIVN